MSPGIRYRLGIDIGGTFTDIVLASSTGSLSTYKTLTSVNDFGRGIATGAIRALEAAEATPASVDRIVHGTTIATNAILEHNGARTALVTTRGFRDVLEMRRLRIPEMYTLNFPRPDPLVPRQRRLEVTERIGPDGNVRLPLEESSVIDTANRLVALNVDAVAISLLHAYANPLHEQRVASMLRAALGPEVFICCSSDVLPVIREYERTSTTVINAFLGPTLKRYFDSLQAHLRGIGIDAPIHIMKSDGGIMTIGAAVLRPAAIVESGPAAGVIGAAALLHAGTVDSQSPADAITFDMGGTTAKVSLIEAGVVTKTGDYEVGAGINLSAKLVMGGGYALKLPVIDISEVGAGGGSLVTMDRGGFVRVGPRSAGAHPGPVCYGHGGTLATFTDAVLTLGFLNPDTIAGGSVRLHPEQGRAALKSQIADPLGHSSFEAAYGVLQVACGTMVRAVKAVSTYRGRDPRHFALFAFGGNGPLVAAFIADALEMTSVIIPPHPGVFSAYGLLCAKIEHEIVRTYLVRLADTTSATLEARYTTMERELRERLLTEGHDHYHLSRQADLRYAGQAHELTVPLPERARGAIDCAQLAHAFGKEHERTYGHQAESEEVECVTLRVTAQVDDDREVPALASMTRSQPARITVREAYFGGKFGAIETPIVGRHHLGTAVRAGPMIIEEADATCVVPPDWCAMLDSRDNIILSAARGG
ncbi:MAG: hydantoinase/oxoprolinase family protein [Burkholderiales bacterium]